MSPQPKKFSNEEIIRAYKETGSVWKAAKLLGACGQSVWERLKRLNYTLPGEAWAQEEIKELVALAPQCTIGNPDYADGADPDPFTGTDPFDEGGK